MRRFLALLAIVVMAVGLAACSCGGLPTVTFRAPVQFDNEVPTTAGPRLQQMPPRFAYPTFTEAPSSCAPGYAGYQYAPPPPPQYTAPAGGAPCR